jgi:hypothetical protein
MTEEQYNTYCDKIGIPYVCREEDREHIETFASYKQYELSLAVWDLKKSILDALPKWMKRGLK